MKVQTGMTALGNHLTLRRKTEALPITDIIPFLEPGLIVTLVHVHTRILHKFLEMKLKDNFGASILKIMHMRELQNIHKNVYHRRQAFGTIMKTPAETVLSLIGVTASSPSSLFLT